MIVGYESYWHVFAKVMAMRNPLSQGSEATRLDASGFRSQSKTSSFRFWSVGTRPGRSRR